MIKDQEEFEDVHFSGIRAILGVKIQIHDDAISLAFIPAIHRAHA